MAVIVTDVHYRMSLALIRDLSEARIPVITCEKELYKDDPAAPPLGFLSKYVTNHVWLPDRDPVKALESICRKEMENCGYLPPVLPVGAKTLKALAENRERFDKVSGLCIPTAAQLDLFNDKEAVAQLAEVLDVPRPSVYTREEQESTEHFLDRVPLPCVVKPRCGEKLGLSARERYYVAKTRDRLQSSYSHFTGIAGEEPIVQEYLPGAGLGCSVLAENGEVLTSICHRRVREYPISGGPSSCCVSIADRQLEEYTAAMVKHVGYSGIAMFEFKEDANGHPRILEINPRVWGSYPLTRATKSGFTLAWYNAAFRNGNGRDGIDFTPRPIKKKMNFSFSDLMAGIGYLQKGKPLKALGALADILNPTVRDGLFEWRDPAPGIQYFKSLWKKEKSK